jgi:hypothetical protein
MRTFIILILFCASVYGADTVTTNIVGDITTKISERSAADGKPEVRIETVYRVKTKVLQIVSHRNKQGALAVVSRAYFASGKLHMVESDDDGDGFFESVMVFDPTTEDFEMFTRQADGSVIPVPTEKLDAIKKKKAAADESLGKLLHEMSPKE